MNQWVFDYLDKLFITKNNQQYSANPVIFVEKDVVGLNIFSLWGVDSFIVDYNIQEDLLNTYPHGQLTTISNLMVNGLVLYQLQWSMAYNPIFYHPYRKYLQKYLQGYSYHEYKKPMETPKETQWNYRQWNPNPIRVGQAMGFSSIGSWYYNHPIKKNLKKNNIQRSLFAGI
jgi:hypothetical protein